MYDMSRPYKCSHPVNNDFIPVNSNTIYTIYIISYKWNATVTSLNYIPTGVQFLQICGKNMKMLPYTIRYLDLDICNNIYNLDKLPVNLQMLAYYCDDNIYNLPPFIKYLYMHEKLTYKKTVYLIGTYLRLNKIISDLIVNTFVELGIDVAGDLLERSEPYKYEIYRHSCMSM